MNLLDFATEYPEHSKLATIGYKATPAAEFLAWLSTQGYSLGDSGLVAEKADFLVAAYCGVDIEALRAERARMCGQQGKE